MAQTIDFGEVNVFDAPAGRRKLGLDTIIAELRTEIAAGGGNLFIQKTKPTAAGPWLWIETMDGGDLTFWVEDGS